MRVAETLLEGCPVQVTAERAADNVERFLIEGRSRRVWRIRVLLTLLEFLPIPLYGAAFSELSAASRRQLIEERLMEGNHIWGVCAKVRLLVLMGIYGDAQAYAATGVLPVPDRPRMRNGSATPSAQRNQQLRTR